MSENHQTCDTGWLGGVSLPVILDCVFFSFGKHSWQRLHNRGLLENEVPDKGEISNSSAIVRYRHLFVVSINQSLKFRQKGGRWHFI